jgi:hypothetical protein
MRRRAKDVWVERSLSVWIERCPRPDSSLETECTSLGGRLKLHLLRAGVAEEEICD